MHITNKTLCGTWNGSDGILGLHNFNGTLARVPAGHNYPTNWTASNEAWRFTNNCVGCTPIALPVELTDFFVICNNNSASVNWTTATETNNDFFTIERSADAINYETVTTVKGAGNSSTAQHYSYSDKEMLSGISYYRIKQTDFDGNYTYSNAMVSDCNAIKRSVTYYPNPFGNEINIKVNNLSADNATIEIVDMLGNIVAANRFNNINKANNEFKMDVSGIAAGTYFVRFTSDTFYDVSKVFKNTTSKN